MAMQRKHLVIIDPQNDFCDLPESYCPADPVRSGERYVPALPVKGAHEDMLRVSELIQRGARGLTDISVTLDSHQRIDIAHPTFWQQVSGEAVLPFTRIKAIDVREGRYVPLIAGSLERVVQYLEALEQAGRYTHMVWPVHCEIGSFGHCVHRDVRVAYNRWEEATLCTVAKISKGQNAWTEHYSALRAEVPDPLDPATELNHAFIARLKEADLVLITGEAGSHCVKATTEHIVENWDQDPKKLVLVTDCMSPVTGFEAQYGEFLENMRARGVELATSADVIRELMA